MTYDTFNKRETQMHINQAVVKTSGATALNRTIHGKLNYIMVKPEQQAITDWGTIKWNLQKYHPHLAFDKNALESKHY